MNDGVQPVILGWMIFVLMVKAVLVLNRRCKLFNFRKKTQESTSEIRLFFNEKIQDVDIETNFTPDRVFEFCIVLSLLKDNVQKKLLDSIKETNPTSYALVFSIIQSMSRVKNGEIRWSEHMVDFSDEENHFSDNQEDDIIITPFGYLTSNDGNPIRDLKYLVGDTNFDLAILGDVISRTPGVDLYKQISKYKFAIMVGKLFDDELVKEEIEKTLCDSAVVTDDKIAFGLEETQKIDNEIAKLQTQSDFWVCYMFPNGNIESKTFENEFDYKENLEHYKILLEMSEGLLLTWEDKIE